MSPTLRDGVVHWEVSQHSSRIMFRRKIHICHIDWPPSQDSPLVKAIKHGRVLMIDEADKAPLQVTNLIRSANLPIARCRSLLGGVRAEGIGGGRQPTAGWSVRAGVAYPHVRFETVPWPQADGRRCVRKDSRHYRQARGLTVWSQCDTSHSIILMRYPPDPMKTLTHL